MMYHDEVELTKNIKVSLIKEIDGFKVGIVGYLLPENVIWKEKGTVEILDIVESLNKECHRLKFKEKVNVIIALSHGSFDADRLIAHSLKYVNVIVGSGSTTFLYNGDPPDIETPVDTYPSKVIKRNGDLVLIAHAYEYLKYMGKLNVQFTNDGRIKGFFGAPILLDSSVPQDPEMSELIEGLKKEVLHYDQKVLSTCSVFLEGVNCRYQECNFGNMVMDAMVEYRANQYEGPGWTDAAVALMNSGSITTDINSPLNDNKIFYDDIMRALPFSEMLHIVEIVGYDLLFILEISTAGLDPSSSVEGLLTSGLKIMFDFENRFGQRVKLVKVRCAECDIPEYFPLDLEKRYKVIITSYLLKGGSGFAIIRDVVWNPISVEARDNEVTIKYLEKSSYVNPEIGGRLIPYDKRFAETKSNCFSFRFGYACYHFLLILMIFITSLLK
nr:protein 5NUC-like [Onthophagus taurus]